MAHDAFLLFTATPFCAISSSSCLSSKPISSRELLKAIGTCSDMALKFIPTSTHYSTDRAISLLVSIPCFSFHYLVSLPYACFTTLFHYLMLVSLPCFTTFCLFHYLLHTTGYPECQPPVDGLAGKLPTATKDRDDWIDPCFHCVRHFP